MKKLPKILTILFLSIFILQMIGLIILFAIPEKSQARSANIWQNMGISPNTKVDCVVYSADGQYYTHTASRVTNESCRNLQISINQGDKLLPDYKQVVDGSAPVATFADAVDTPSITCNCSSVSNRPNNVMEFQGYDNPSQCNQVCTDYYNAHPNLVLPKTTSSDSSQSSNNTIGNNTQSDINFIPQVTISEDFKQGQSYPISEYSIGKYILAIYQYGIGIVGVLAAVVLMYGGIRWLTSGGSSEKIGDAKAWIGAALSGLVLALASFLILSTINPELVKIQSIKPQAIQPVTGDRTNPAYCQGRTNGTGCTFNDTTVNYSKPGICLNGVCSPSEGDQSDECSGASAGDNCTGYGGLDGRCYNGNCVTGDGGVNAPCGNSGHSTCQRSCANRDWVGGRDCGVDTSGGGSVYYTLYCCE